MFDYKRDPTYDVLTEQELMRLASKCDDKDLPIEEVLGGRNGLEDEDTVKKRLTSSGSGRRAILVLSSDQDGGQATIGRAACRQRLKFEANLILTKS